MNVHPQDDTAEDSGMERAVRLLLQDPQGFAEWVDSSAEDDLFVRDNSGNTLMHWSAAIGDVPMMDVLLFAGLPLECRNRQQATPVLCAAASSPNPAAALSYLVSKGADIDVMNADGDTMKSLLRRRRLAPVATLIETMKRCMDMSSDYFLESGAELTDISWDVNRRLGVVDALFIPSTEIGRGGEHSDENENRSSLAGVTRDSKTGAAAGGRPPRAPAVDPHSTQIANDFHHHHYPSWAQPQQQQQRPGTGGAPANSVSSSAYLVPFQNVPVGSLGSDSTLVRDGTSTFVHCCDAAWWLAEREQEVFILTEQVVRDSIVRQYYVNTLDIALSAVWGAGAGVFASTGPSGQPQHNIHCVLGERWAEGQRMLLVRFRDAAGEPVEGSEDFVPYSAVARDPVVRRYLARAERSSSSLSTPLGMFASDSRLGGAGLGIGGASRGGFSDSGAVPEMDSAERHEIEAELRMLRRRRVSDGTTATTSAHSSPWARQSPTGRISSALGAARRILQTPLSNQRDNTGTATPDSAGENRSGVVLGLVMPSDEARASSAHSLISAPPSRRGVGGAEGRIMPQRLSNAASSSYGGASAAGRPPSGPVMRDHNIPVPRASTGGPQRLNFPSTAGSPAGALALPAPPSAPPVRQLGSMLELPGDRLINSGGDTTHAAVASPHNAPSTTRSPTARQSVPRDTNATTTTNNSSGRGTSVDRSEDGHQHHSIHSPTEVSITKAPQTTNHQQSSAPCQTFVQAVAPPPSNGASGGSAVGCGTIADSDWKVQDLSTVTGDDASTTSPTGGAPSTTSGAPLSYGPGHKAQQPYKLSDTQKYSYEQFLYNSALQILKKKHNVV